MEEHLKRNLLINCPQCGEIIEWNDSNRNRPFCSEKCKALDLSQWATDSYRIPGKNISVENDQELN